MQNPPCCYLPTVPQTRGWATPFVKLRAAILARDTSRIVELAFLERMQPSFDEAVATLQTLGIGEITVAPIFLAIGGHMRKDLPKAPMAKKEQN